MVSFLPTRSWTIRFFKEHLDHLTLGSTVRFWRYSRQKHKNHSIDPTLRLRFRGHKGDVSLRSSGSDMATYKEVFLTKVYENALALAGECKHVIDLGANIGLASLLIASRNPQCKIMAVEPSSENLALLESNLRCLIADGRCVTQQIAVWGENSKVVLTKRKGSDRYSSFQVEKGDEGDPISAMHMNDLVVLSGFPKIDFLKVDVEGAEVEMFNEQTDWLDLVQTLAIEFHGDTRTQSGFDDTMARYGFCIKDDNGHTVVAQRGR